MMTDPVGNSPEHSRSFPRGAAHWLLSRRVRLVLAWVLATYAGCTAIYFAWTSFDDQRRPDGNWGHANIDFGGQWLMGRMLVEGHGQDLYDRRRQREVLERVYPETDHVPGFSSDAGKMMSWFMGEDTSSTNYRGGPLYPPVHALVMAPLGMLPPRPAYRITQIIILLLTFALGRLIHVWTGGRIWQPVATVLIMIFPGYAGAINLAQNPLFSLALLLVGWRQLALGRPFLAGCIWGCLAYKPVWAVSFFLVPVLTGRWRMMFGMMATGTFWILATLPFVGLHSWFDWLEIGRQASIYYQVDANWITLSRDMQNLPLRYLLNLEGEDATRSPHGSFPYALGKALWVGVILTWIGIALLRRRAVRSLTGPGATFVLLGAWLSCYHFVYYDSLLAACPVFLLVAGMRSSWPMWKAGLWLSPLFGLHYFCQYVYPEWKFEPVDLFVLLILWGWCGWVVVARRIDSGTREGPQG